MKRKNKTFRGETVVWANACVGNNGHPSYVEYAVGFSTAANKLIELVLDNQSSREFNVDDLVYPVCFNMRHSVELRLKGAIEDLQLIAKKKKIELNFNLDGSHDIGNIWGFFKSESEKLDGRYKQVNASIEPIILDIAEVDATGQTFRYPNDTESKKHLTDVALINFVVLKFQFGRLEKGLDILLNLSKYLIQEYSLGTFTTKLSRRDLFTLAEELPDISSWNVTLTKEIKLSLQEKYNLSSNDLTNAINEIKENYELISKVGGQLQLRGVDKEGLIWFLNFWMKIHPKRENTGNKSCIVEMDIESIINETSRTDEIKNNLLCELDNNLTVERLAGLKTLFYFANDKDFSENYMTRFELELRRAESDHSNGVSARNESFMHLIDKTNFFSNLIISLYFLHHGTFADELIGHYEVTDSFHFLGRAKSRELFKLPDFAGY